MKSKDSKVKHKRKYTKKSAFWKNAPPPVFKKINPPVEVKVVWDSVDTASIAETKRSALTVPELLRKAGETYEQRNAKYGNNYKRVGAILSQLYANGLPPLKTADDWNRW